MMLSLGRKVGIIAALAVVAAQAQTADQIWTAGYVVTMDVQRRVIADGAVAVSGTKIVAVGPRVDIVRRFPGAARLDRPQAILMPGLINTHTHAAMTLLRGIADDRTLQDWLEHYIFPAEKKNVTPEFVLDGTRLACLEMLLSGATTFGHVLLRGSGGAGGQR